MRVKVIARNTTIYILSVMQLLFFPLAFTGSSFAQTAENSTPSSSQQQTQTNSTTESEQSNTPATTTTETATPLTTPEVPPLPPGPRGADAKTFTYNSSTNLYENDLYTYNPVNQTRTAKIVPDVRYNFQTKLWEKLGWKFSAPLQDYVPYVVSTSTKQPSGIVIGAIPNTSTSTVPAPTASNGSINGASRNNANATSGLQSNNTGPNSTINSTNNLNNNINLDYNNSTQTNITLSLLSQSGNASVLGNTNGGNATSGNANSNANVINMVQSGWNLDGVLSFNADLYGDLYGDLYVNTSQLGPNSNLNVDNNINNDFDINVSNDIGIKNDIDVVASTGNATVSGNTNGGNATTGNANAAANILNLIDTNINSSGSFIGFLNIYGQLDGDILFPEGALQTIISNTGPGSTIDSSKNVDNVLNADINNNTSIANNTNATATSGDAVVSGNTNGGNATSGQANSNVNIINLTGREVVSENTLLVFINVLGSWVGVLMDAPGLTAAAVGGDVSVNNDVNNDLNLTQNNNVTIENNINTTATTGDATVNNNTNGGNATTGDATSSINVANLTGSNIVNSSWFGVLFINVFGGWNGSFGVDTEAGNNRPTQSQGSGGIGGESNGNDNSDIVSESNKNKPRAYVLAASTSTSDKGDLVAVPVTTSAASNNGGGVVLADNTATKDSLDEAKSTSDGSIGAVLADNDGENIAEEAAAGSLENTGNTMLTYVIVGTMILLVLFGNRIFIALSGALPKK